MASLRASPPALSARIHWPFVDFRDVKSDGRSSANIMLIFKEFLELAGGWQPIWRSKILIALILFHTDKSHTPRYTPVSLRLSVAVDGCSWTGRRPSGGSASAALLSIPASAGRLRESIPSATPCAWLRAPPTLIRSANCSVREARSRSSTSTITVTDLVGW